MANDRFFTDFSLINLERDLENRIKLINLTDKLGEINKLLDDFESE